MKMLIVASASSPTSVAGALSHVLNEDSECSIRAIGAGAVNQMVKSIAISNGHQAMGGKSLSCVPVFEDLEVNGEDRTAIKFIVKVTSCS